MTSKELNEIFSKTRRTQDISLTTKQVEELVKDLEELEYYRNEKYKHWNIFFNGAKLEYLLYLEQRGKESFMTSISEELFSKINEHFNK